MHTTRHIAVFGLVLAAALASSTASAAVFTNTRDVADCAPTRDGVWTATSGGLALVSPDGRTKRVWTAVDGLPATRVHALLVEGDVVWVGTERGLARVSYASDTLTVHQTIASKAVHAIARHAGSLYVGTWGDGVEKVDLARRKLSPYRMIGGDKKLRSRITALTSHRRALWATTAGSGLFQGKASGTMRHVAGKLSRAYAWSLLSRRGALWVGSLDGTYRITGADTKLVHTADARDFAVVSGSVKAAAFGSGLVSLGHHSGSAAKHAGPRKAVLATAMGANRHGTCIGTKTGMWTRRAGTRWRKARLGGPISNDISALAIDGPRVWVGMFDKGLGVFEGDKFRTVHHKNLDHYVNGIAVERGKHTGRVWVATNYGLSMLHKGKAVRFTRREGMPSDMVFGVTALRHGGVIAATARGAIIVKDGTTQVISSKHSVMGRVWSVAEASDGSLWLGTTLGAYHGRPGKRWTRYSVATGHLKNDWVTAIAVKGRSAWIGTYNAGVTRIDLDQPTAVATHLGGGWVNPGGLHVAGNSVYASTMDGALVHSIGTEANAGANTWRKTVSRRLGKDTTVTVSSPRGLWIATRRGLQLVARR